MSGSADGLTDCVRLLPGPDLLVFPAGPDASVHWSRNTDYYKVGFFLVHLQNRCVILCFLVIVVFLLFSLAIVVLYINCCAAPRGLKFH